MPLYICNAVRGAIPVEAMAPIAEDLARLHDQLAGSVKRLAHVFFFEDAPKQPICGKSVFLVGTIIEGRTRLQKAALAARLKDIFKQHTSLSDKQMVIEFTEIPTNWVMEGGVVIADQSNSATNLEQ